MPTDNCFRHQRYEVHPPPERFRLVTPPEPVGPDSPRFAAQLAAAAEPLRRQGVRTIYLLHGTMAGTDSIGIHREIKRFAPAFGSSLGHWQKFLFDLLAQDWANYSQEFAETFEQAINAEGQPQIRVRRFMWSSENHHTGRAVAALRLLVELSRQSVEDRAMLWGHSHAGNVFAILTNLIGSDLEQRERFLACFGTWLQRCDPELWQAASDLLRSSKRPCVTPPDVVTFGTPIRYGWEAGGYRHLLHIVNHHPMGDPPDRVPFPPTAEQLRVCAAGDYFQQLFIAGTNFLLPIWACGQWRVERALNRLMQPGLPTRKLVESLRQGRRVADDGLTLLVDYNRIDPGATALNGHAVYTRLSWLPFHAQQVAQML